MFRVFTSSSTLKNLKKLEVLGAAATLLLLFLWLQNLEALKLFRHEEFDSIVIINDVGAGALESFFDVIYRGGVSVDFDVH
jgi:hypothetical protein